MHLKRCLIITTAWQLFVIFTLSFSFISSEYYFVKSIISPVASYRPPQHNHHQFSSSLLFGGVTSVHYSSGDSILVVGTKKGKIYNYNYNYNYNYEQSNNNDKIGNNNSVTKKEKIFDDNNKNNDDGILLYEEIISNNYSTKYPIYSIAVSSSSSSEIPSIEEDRLLFCGSGDRWISVWRKKVVGNNGNNNGGFEFVQRLGPHTGWVKDLVFDKRNFLLHSIGCNCIESWDCSIIDNNNTAPTSSFIRHVTKRTITNSPTLGSTLSSDLLCLCLVPTSDITDDEESSSQLQLLVSGGVDGRIHLWFSDPTTTATTSSSSNIADTHNRNYMMDEQKMVPVHTISAHEGRVNSIVWSSAVNAIFTIGNDGVLCIFRVSSENGFQLQSRLKINKGISVTKEVVTPTTRLTTVSLTTNRNIQEQRKKCSLVLGSSNGDIYFVTAEITPGNGILCQLLDDLCTTIEGNPMIYSIAYCEGDNTTAPPRLLIGHATGFATLECLE
ncbi:MAG: hypothetical protein ACI8RD_008135 [Bacillariaceae sp.]|jgi:hypothetical protein